MNIFNLPLNQWFNWNYKIGRNFTQSHRWFWDRFHKKPTSGMFNSFGYTRLDWFAMTVYERWLIVTENLPDDVRGRCYFVTPLPDYLVPVQKTLEYRIKVAEWKRDFKPETAYRLYSETEVNRLLTQPWWKDKFNEYEITEFCPVRPKWPWTWLMDEYLTKMLGVRINV